MRHRVLPAVLALFVLTLLVIGCGGGGSSGSSFSSSWLNTIPVSGAWQVDIMPSAVSVKPEQAISVSVLVKDSYGHPLDGVKLVFASQLGGTFEDKTVETVKGWASNVFTAGKQPGTESIVVQTNEASVSKSILIQNVVVTNPAVQLVLSSSSTLAGNAVTVAVGVSVDNAAADDVIVNLSSTLKGDFSSDSGKTDKGWFTTTFKPDNDAAGVGTITAMVNGTRIEQSLAVVKQKVNTPTLTISVSPDSVFQGQTAAVIVIAKDAAGSPSTAKLSFGTSLSGSFNPDDGTPTDGMFFTEFTAGKEVGSATLTVFSIDASASTVLSIEKPEIVMKISPSMNTVKVGERVPVSVLVTDTFSRPIEAAPVYLSAELGCYCSPEDGKTNDDGYFFFDFVASKTAGISKIHALTTSATASAQLTVVGP